MPQLPLVQQPQHPLFGGAIQMKIADTFRDTSVIQPLDDTREQFYSPELRMTLVIDLMIKIDKNIDDALNTYLNDIDICSDSKTTIDSTFKQQNWSFLTGFSEGGQRQGKICLGLLRNDKANTDILVYIFSQNDESTFIQECIDSALSLTVKDYNLFLVN